MQTVIAIQPRFKPMPQKFEVSCASCNLRELCLPAGLCAEDLERVENIVYARRRIKRGEALFNAGVQFSAVYAIRSGFFKTSVLDGDGREQVTGFFMGGELVGLDGLGSGTYNATAVALEDSEDSQAALITPDRNLARRVGAELARFGIEADDSAGTPLSSTMKPRRSAG